MLQEMVECASTYIDQANEPDSQRTRLNEVLEIIHQLLKYIKLQYSSIMGNTEKTQPATAK